MTIDYLPWNRPAMLADRVCMRDTQVELTYAEVAPRVDAVAGQLPRNRTLVMASRCWRPTTSPPHRLARCPPRTPGLLTWPC